MKFYSKDAYFFSEVSKVLDKQNSSVCVVHLSFWEQTGGELKNKWIVVEDSLEPKDIVSQVFSKDINHFVQKNGEAFVGDLKRASILVENPKVYFEDNFLMIDEQDVVSVAIPFATPDDKPALMDKAFEFLAQLKSSPAQEGALAAIEELYMNALMDAPAESQRLGIEINSSSGCELFLAFNKDVLQISCTDPYGSLDLKKLFSRLNEVYQKGAGDAINLQGPGGAGIGSYLVFEHCQALIFGVRRGVQTKVTCLIPRTPSRRERAKIKKSLHGFEVSE